MSSYIPSDLTKMAIIKASLTGKDRKAVEHLSSVGAIISYINSKYLKPDMILNILLQKAYSINEPWTLAQSLKNIEDWLLLVSSFFEFKMERHINSKLRDDMTCKLFTETYRFRFVEMIQAYETTLLPEGSNSTEPLSICMENLTTKSEVSEIASFTTRLESVSDPIQEEKRLNFWLESIKKLALHIRQLSLYSEDKKSSPPHNQFYEQPFKHNSAKGGGGGATRGTLPQIILLGLPQQAHDPEGETNAILGCLPIFSRPEYF